MINRILMELYDEYIDNNNIDSLLEFTKKTLPSDGTDKLFIGCVLIMFSIAGGYKPRYFCTRENLLGIVLLAKEKIGEGNLLDFYVNRVNTVKGINKYLDDITKDQNIDKYADLIINYLDQFKLDFVTQVKNHNSLEKYIKSIDKKTNCRLEKE